MTPAKENPIRGGADIDQISHHTLEEKERQFLDTEAKINELQRTIDQLHTKNFDLVNQLASCEKNLDDQVQCWNSAHKQGDLERALFLYQQEIVKLKKDINKLRTVSRFMNTTEAAADHPTEARIANEFENIRSRSKMTFKLSDGLTPLIPDHIPPESDTELLLQALLIGESETSTLSSSLLDCITSTKPQSIIRAVIGVSLRDWVFDSDWPDFDKEKSQPLRKYREYILLQEGKGNHTSNPTGR